MKKYLMMLLMQVTIVTLFSQYMSVPPRIQAAMFMKIFQYDSRLKDKTTIQTLIVYDDKSKKYKDDISNAFKNAGLKTESVHVNDIDGEVAEADVIYLMPGIVSVNRLSQMKNRLTISPSSKMAEKGNCTIGLDLEQETPRIYINMSSLEKEGHNLSPQLLKIAKIYK